MNTIHKYVTAGVAGKVQVFTYEGATFVTVANQDEQIAVWALVNSPARGCFRTLHIVGTGGEAPSGGVYVGTVVMADGSLEFHVYAEPEVVR